MEELAEKTKWGDKYGRACQMTDPVEAAEYFEVCVQHMMKYGGYPREQAESIERQNIGYWAGYYDAGVYDRVMKLYGTAHPVFGTAYPSMKEAFTAGERSAKNAT